MLQYLWPCKHVIVRRAYILKSSPYDRELSQICTFREIRDICMCLNCRLQQPQMNTLILMHLIPHYFDAKVLSSARLHSYLCSGSTALCASTRIPLPLLRGHFRRQNQPMSMYYNVKPDGGVLTLLPGAKIAPVQAHPSYYRACKPHLRGKNQRALCALLQRLRWLVQPKWSAALSTFLVTKH